MENMDTNSVSACSNESSSHTTTPDDIPRDPPDLTPYLYYNHDTYVDDEPVVLTQALTARLMTHTTTSRHNQGVDPRITSAEIGQADQGADSLLYLTPSSIISNMAPDPAQDQYFTSNLSHSMSFGGPSFSQTDRINPYPFQFDKDSATMPPSPHPTTPYYSAHTSPGSIGWDLAAGINVSTLLGVEDPEIEKEDPFLSPRLFGYCYAPPLKDGQHNSLEGEAGEEEMSSASSSAEQPQGFTSPLMGSLTTSIMEGKDEEGSRKAETTIDEATPDLQCPGISGQNEAATLAGLLKTAGEYGAENRELALGKLTQSGQTSECIECGKKGRRDRLLAHVLYTHLELKTWTCPLCRKAYATRDALTQHLKAIKVACLCEHYITKNNWYEHAKKCKACLAVAGGLKIEKGRVVAAQPTVAQAQPSVRGPSPDESEREGLAYTPQVPRSRPAVGRNASKKRKTRELDGSSGDEFKEGRKPKRVKRNRT